MTIYLVAACVVLLSMSKSVFQAFAEAAPPHGMCSAYESLDILAKF